MNKEKYFLKKEYSRISLTLAFMLAFSFGMIIKSWWGILIFPITLILVYFTDKHFAPKKTNKLLTPKT